MTQATASPAEWTCLQRALAPLTASQSEQFHKQGLGVGFRPDSALAARRRAHLCPRRDRRRDAPEQIERGHRDPATHLGKKIAPRPPAYGHCTGLSPYTRVFKGAVPAILRIRRTSIRSSPAKQCRCAPIGALRLQCGQWFPEASLPRG